METVTDCLYMGSKITEDDYYNHEIKKHSFLGRKATTKTDSILESKDITLQTKVHLAKAMIVSSSHVWMWELGHKEGWVPKNWCLWTVVLKKTLERPLEYKQIKSVSPKENQSWIVIGRIDAADEAPIFWSHDVKSQLIGKDPDARKAWRQKKELMTEDEMVTWHHQLDRHEFEQTLGVPEGQGSLGCSSPWGRKESGMTEWLNKTTRNSSKHRQIWRKNAKGKDEGILVWGGWGERRKRRPKSIQGCQLLLWPHQVTPEICLRQELTMCIDL